MAKIGLGRQCLFTALNVHTCIYTYRCDVICAIHELFVQERKVLAAQNIAMQCFVKLCTKFGVLLLVSCACIYVYMYICVYSAS